MKTPESRTIQITNCQIGRTDKTLFTQAKGNVISGAPNKHPIGFLLVEAVI